MGVSSFTLEGRRAGRTWTRRVVSEPFQVPTGNNELWRWLFATRRRRRCVDGQDLDQLARLQFRARFEAVQQPKSSHLVIGEYRPGGERFDGLARLDLDHFQTQWLRSLVALLQLPEAPDRLAE